MYQVSEALDKVISGSGRTFYARLNGISEGIQEIVQTNFSTPDSYFYVGGATAVSYTHLTLPTILLV